MIPNYSRALALLPLLLATLFPFTQSNSQTATYTTPGAATFTVPVGVTSITVEAWGGGGRGGSRTTAGEGGGGGGGGYSKKVLAVSSGTIYNLFVGGGSSSGTIPGGDSWFDNNTVLLAKGGNSVQDNTTTGASGAAVGIGDVIKKGGDGANAPGGSSNSGGGGGSSAGSTADGTNATGNPGAIAPAGGGNGGNGATGNNNPGSPGLSPGGGGGGADKQGSSNQPGGNGANGKVVVSYVLCSPIDCTISGTSTMCPASTENFSAPAGLSYSWSLTGVGEIISANNIQTITVESWPVACNNGITLTVTVTDVNGCTSSCNKIVTNYDPTGPTISCPADITVNTDAGLCTASGVALGNPMANDNCGVASVTNNAPATFPAGTTQVIWTATDYCNYTATCVQNVTVIDNEDPVITCPSDITITAEEGECGAIVDFEATATDNCGAEVTYSNNRATFFAVGTTVVTATATDDAGNTDECTFSVTVTDDEEPSAGCADITIQLDDDGMASIEGEDVDAGSSDPCGIESLSVSPSAFDCSDVGANIVQLTVTDNNGNTAVCTAMVTVEDNVNPVALCRDVTLSLDEDGNAAIPGGDELVFYNYSCDRATLGFSNVSQSFTSLETGYITRIGAGIGLWGTAVSYGTIVSTASNTVDYGVLSYSGRCCYSMCAPGNNMAYLDLPVPFFVNAGESVTISFSGNSGEMHFEDNQLRLYVTGETSAAQYLDDGSSDACGIASFSVSQENFDCSDAGQNIVVLTVTDVNGNTNTCTSIVTIEDNMDPEVACPANINQGTDEGECGAIVTFNASVSDNCGADLTYSHEPGSFFDVGITTVTVTATDDAGNTDECTFSITITDDEDPVVTCPENINQGTDEGECGAIVTFSATAADNCDADLSYSHEPGSFFDVGTTTVTVTATDDEGNTDECTFNVTITDNEDPEITCPSNVEQTADEGVCEAAVTVGTPSTSDNCPGESATNDYNGTSDASDTYPVGETVVTWTVEDAHGNTSQCTMTVTVTDDEAPEITCPSNVEQTSDEGVCEAAVTVGAPSTSDNCPGESATNDYNGTSDASDTYPVGETVVTWTVEDAHGNTSQCTMTVTVTDDEAPEITCPSDVEQTADEGVCEAAVTVGTPTTSDNCPGESATNDYNGTSDASDTYPVGETVVTWTVEDAHGNTSQCTMTVTVTDDEAPEITCPSNVEQTADEGVCEAAVTVGAPSTSDNCPGESATNDYNGTSDASDTYPVGETIVTWTVEDAHGNTSQCTMTVTVTDNEEPEITCPSDVEQTADPGECGADVLISAPLTTDNCPGESATNDYNNTSDASDFYPVGITIVTWTVEDAHGNTSQCTMTVTVTDDEAPEITCPSNVEQTADEGVCEAAVIVGAPSTSDNCPGESATNDYNGTSDASDTYPVGETVVTWTVEDAHGNSSQCTMTVTVTDDEAPEITCPSNVEQTADEGVCEAAVTVGAPATSDNCPGESATNDYNGTSDASDIYPVGETVVTWTVEDAHGNTSQCTMTVTVTDDEAPEITCPSNVEQTADEGVCEAAVTVGTPLTSDNCPGENATNDYNGTSDASDTYPVGETVVTWTVEDAHGNTSQCTMTVTVTDDEAPEITCPSNVEQTADEGVCEAAVTVGAPSTSDNCPGESATNDYNGTSDASDTYPVGETVVTWTVEDAHGNTSQCTMTVTITDDEDPSLACPDVSVPYDPATCTSVTIDDPEFGDNCEVIKLTWSMSGATTGSSSSEGINTVGTQTFGFGTTYISYMIEDNHGNTSTCSFEVEITEAITTSSITVEPSSRQYSDKVTFTATITGGASDCGPDAATEATFYVGAQEMGTAVFMESGDDLVAVLSDVALLEGISGQMSPGVKTVSAVFSGIDSHYDVGQPAAVNLTITKEDALVEYNGQQYFSTPNQNNCTGTVVLSSYVEDNDDGSRGDIRNATITFYRDFVGGTVLGTANLPVGLINPDNIHEGIAITEFVHTLTGANCSDGGETFEVWIAANNYYMGSTPEATLVTLALPGNEFVTGGGHLVLEESAGTYAGTDGSKMNFGFNVKWNPSGHNLQGKINVIFRKWQLYEGVWQWRTYQIKSNKINSMVIDESDPNYRKAIISTKANLRDVTDPLYPISLGGNLNLAMNAWESTTENNGSLDKISVQLVGSGGQGLLFSSFWQGGATVPQIIDGGKINVKDGNSQNYVGEFESDKPAIDEHRSEDLDVTGMEIKGRNYLLINKPNPFNGSTEIPVIIGETSMITLKVYNAIGEVVAEIFDGVLAPGRYEFRYTPLNVSDGIYFYSMWDGKNVQTIPMIISR